MPLEPLLTPRNKDVLLFLAGGNSNQQIARELNISANTVKTHCAPSTRSSTCQPDPGRAGRLEIFPLLRVLVSYVEATQAVDE